MLCTKFAILRPESGYVIVDDSPSLTGPLGSMQPNPGHVLAAYGEGDREAAIAHLTRLLDEEDDDRGLEEAQRRQEEADGKAAAAEPDTGPGTKVAGRPTFFDRADDAEVR